MTPEQVIEALEYARVPKAPQAEAEGAGEAEAEAEGEGEGEEPSSGPGW